MQNDKTYQFYFRFTDKDYQDNQDAIDMFKQMKTSERKKFMLEKLNAEVKDPNSRYASAYQGKKLESIISDLKDIYPEEKLCEIMNELRAKNPVQA